MINMKMSKGIQGGANIDFWLLGPALGCVGTEESG